VGAPSRGGTGFPVEQPASLRIIRHFGRESATVFVVRFTSIEGKAMAKGPISKSDLIQILVDKFANLTRKDVKGILESMASIGHVELKKNGVFVVPGLVRMVVVKKPATKARKGINPFTKEPTVFKAKPARKVVKGRPVKAVKDAVA
jgi:DNA-binding protein HU-beta